MTLYDSIVKLSGVPYYQSTSLYTTINFPLKANSGLQYTMNLFDPNISYLLLFLKECTFSMASISPKQETIQLEMLLLLYPNLMRVNLLVFTHVLSFITIENGFKLE